MSEQCVEVLRAHVVHAQASRGAWSAECLAGDWSDTGEGGMFDAIRAHEAHTAAVIEARTLAAIADELDDAADDLDALLTKAARQQGRPHQPATPNWLRDRARILRKQIPTSGADA